MSTKQIIAVVLVASLVASTVVQLGSWIALDQQHNEKLSERVEQVNQRLETAEQVKHLTSTIRRLDANVINLSEDYTTARKNYDSLYIVPSRDVDLIDWYAAFALMGLEANPASTGELAQTIAAEAWLHAKRMMEARKWTREQLARDVENVNALQKESNNGKE